LEFIQINGVVIQSEFINSFSEINIHRDHTERIVGHGLLRIRKEEVIVVILGFSLPPRLIILPTPLNMGTIPPIQHLLVTALALELHGPIQSPICLVNRVRRLEGGATTNRTHLIHHCADLLGAVQGLAL
jgi:hypothetical protein